MITFHAPRTVETLMGIDFQALCDDLGWNGAHVVAIGTFITPFDDQERVEFGRLMRRIETEGEWQGAYDDHTDYYEFGGVVLVLWRGLNDRALLLPKIIRGDIRKMLDAVSNYK
nr:MAG TPA: hypothetical protein [Caudoviricetes sp.]